MSFCCMQGCSMDERSLLIQARALMARELLLSLQLRQFQKRRTWANDQVRSLNERRRSCWTAVLWSNMDMLVGSCSKSCSYFPSLSVVITSTCSIQFINIDLGMKHHKQVFIPIFSFSLLLPLFSISWLCIATTIYNLTNKIRMKAAVILLAVVAVGLGATQLANYPRLNVMKSGDHKLLTASTAGPTVLTYEQPFNLTFSRLPQIAISIRDFQMTGAQTNASVTSNTIDYTCTILPANIATTFFRTTLNLTSTNTFSLLYYMYMGIDLVQWTNTYLYSYSLDTSSLFNDTAGLTNISSFTIAQTVSDISNAVVIPFVMSFRMTTAHEYSYFTSATMTNSSSFDLNLTSNSDLQRVQINVFIVDVTAMELNYTHYFDTGRYEVFNSNLVPTSTFTPISFNYFNYILGVTAFRVSSSFNPNFFLTPSNTIGTLTQYLFVQHTAVHFRQRQCIDPAINKFVVQQQLCYDACPAGYATNSSIDYCVLCHYTCLTCQVDGVSCLTCPLNSSRTHNNVSNSCPCDVGFFDNSTVVCAVCDYTCLVCQTVETNCVSCDPTRTLTNATCPCSTGFYDVGNSTQTCASCDATCLTCDVSPSACTSCNSATHFRVFIASTSQCLCQSGFVDTGAAQCSVATINCTAPCLTCQNSSTTCTSCSTTNNPQDRILSSSQCLCPSFFSAVSATATCVQICGNGLFPSTTSKQCDDGNILGGDGCSGTCTIQTGFTCDNTSPPSICISDAGYVISSQSLAKDQNSNTVTATIVMNPVPPASSAPTLTSLTDALSLQSSSWNRNTLTIHMNLLRAVRSSQLLNLHFSLIGATTTMAMVDSNNAELIPYNEAYYTIYDIERALIWFYIALLWLLTIYRLITDPKLISQVTEVFFYTSLAWIGVQGQELESGALIPIQNLKYVYGYNIVQEENNSLFSVFNISFLYLFIPLLMFAIFLFISKKKPGLITSRTKRFVLYDISFAWLMINGYLIIFGASKSISEEQPFNGVTAGGIVVTVAYLVFMAIIVYRSFFKSGEEQEMNSTLENTKKNLFKPKGYVALWFFSLLISFIYLAIQNKTRINPLLMIGYFLLMFIIIGVGGVYINKLRILLNLISLGFIYGCILLINNVSESAWIGLVIVALLFLQMIGNFVLMYFERNNLKVDEDDLLEEKIRNDKIGNQDIPKGDQTKREIMELEGHTGLFTVYEPKKDVEMAGIPRPSPKDHQQIVLQKVIKNQEENIDQERFSGVKPNLNQFLLTSPKYKQMYDTEVKKEQFIDMENGVGNIDDV